MARNRDLDAVLAVLDRAGVRDYEVVRGSRHYQVRWRFRGQTRMTVVSVNPSDVRSPLNARAETRRLLRMDGLLSEPTISAAPVAAPPCWRAQVETVARRLSQIPIPHDKVGERATIAAALRRLVNPDGIDERDAVARKESVGVAQGA